jgi:hypothetical protein
MSEPKYCAQCGMSLEGSGDYHPYAACLMYAACGDSQTVQANLMDVYRHGAESASKPGDEQ